MSINLPSPLAFPLPGASTNNSYFTHPTTDTPAKRDSVSKPNNAYPVIVSYEGKSIKARVDSNVPVQEIINQLCAAPQLNVQNPSSALYCLRVLQTDQLVTDESLPLQLETGVQLKLVASPGVEATEMVDRMSTRDEKTVKLAVFQLKKFMHEPEFVNAFISKGGLVELVACIETASGNTLAYALTSMQSLLQADSDFQGLDVVFFSRVKRLRFLSKLLELRDEQIIDILSTHSLVNIIRPATAILSQVVEMDPLFDAHRKILYSYGFPVIWPLVSQQLEFFKMLALRLTTSDHILLTQIIQLLVVLTRSALHYQCLDFYEMCERQQIRQSIYKLAIAPLSEASLLSGIIEYQTCLAGFLGFCMNMSVDLSLEENQCLVSEICQNINILEGKTSPQQIAHLGMDDSAVYQTLSSLDLRLLVKSSSLIAKDIKKFSTVQQERSVHEQCSICLAAKLVTEQLASIWGFDQASATQPLEEQPFLFIYDQIYALGLKLFCTIWLESGAPRADLSRIAALTGGHLKFIMSRQNGKIPFSELEQELKNTTYKSVRNRQLDEMAIEDELLTKGPIRNLRAQLYRESFEIVQAQRTKCIQQGEWFPVSMQSVRDSRRGQNSPAQIWRFCRLSPSLKHLHYVESPEKAKIKPSLTDLPYSFAIDTISNISSLSQARLRTSLTSKPSPVPLTPPRYGFAVQTTQGLTMEFYTQHKDTYSEWIDGLSLLRPNGTIHTEETAELVQALTDVGVKVRLLDFADGQLP